MSVHSPSSRAGAAVSVTALLLCTSLGAADAASSAQAASASTIASSASWGAVATTSTAAPYSPGPLVLTFPTGATGHGNGLREPAQFFTVGNSGTLTLSAATYTVTSVATNSAPVAFSVDYCSTGWNESANTCSVPFAVVTSTSAPTLSAVAPSAPGTGLRLRARLTGTSSRSTAVTINLEVARAQVRAATTTGS